MILFYFITYQLYKLRVSYFRPKIKQNSFLFIEEVIMPLFHSSNLFRRLAKLNVYQRNIRFFLYFPLLHTTMENLFDILFRFMWIEDWKLSFPHKNCFSLKWDTLSYSYCKNYFRNIIEIHFVHSVGCYVGYMWRTSFIILYKCPYNKKTF